MQRRPAHCLFGHFLRQSCPAHPQLRLCRASPPFVMPLGLRAPAQMRKERKLCPWFAEPTAEPAALLYALLTFVLFEASRPGARSPPPRSPPAAPWARGFQRGRRATFAPPSAPAAAVVAAFASARLRRRFGPLGMRGALKFSRRALRGRGWRLLAFFL